MMRRPAVRLLLLLVILTTTSIATAQQGEKDKVVRVQLKVSAEPELSDLVRKALESELKTLDRVSLTDSSPELTISVIVLRLTTESRKEVGATFSVIVSESIDARLKQFADIHLTPQAGAELTAILSGTVKPRAHWVETGANRDISEVCRGIIRSFEREILRPRSG